MIISRSAGDTLPQQAGRVLSQTSTDNGDFGFALTTALILGGGFLLGGGGLYALHEKREEKTDYLKCVEKYSDPPYNMSPAEAGMVCRGEEVKKFKFGLNATTVILVAASVFGMWFVTQLMITTAKSKLRGRKGG